MFEDPESITMFPVEVPPMVSVWALVVPRLPSPVRNVALFPEFAEIDAVGVPREVDPPSMNANLAVAVAVEPSIRSTVRFPGDRTGPFSCQKFVPPPPVGHVSQAGAALGPFES